MARFERSTEGWNEAIDLYRERFGVEPPHEMLGDDLFERVEEALETDTPIELDLSDVPDGAVV